jgi:hypothetical protein
MVSVLARTMLAYERLERCARTSPRAWRRAAASTSVRPAGAMSVVPAMRAR